MDVTRTKQRATQKGGSQTTHVPEPNTQQRHRKLWHVSGLRKTAPMVLFKTPTFQFQSVAPRLSHSANSRSKSCRHKAPSLNPTPPHPTHTHTHTHTHELPTNSNMNSLTMRKTAHHNWSNTETNACLCLNTRGTPLLQQPKITNTSTTLLTWPDEHLCQKRNVAPSPSQTMTTQSVPNFSNSLKTSTTRSERTQTKHVRWNTTVVKLHAQ
ncbi:hypothetical protein CSKR_100438 [Clonorchis sinensis]|uniref:Uncharacterized protein n=1 Tax=Clonorchis sinensis TaxID=79923 RepID=A0A419Q9A9_CLOSI|nr:hypothetical protein CSKR_100438 [Clonorchis sinensis]